MIAEYENILNYLKENEDKLKVFLSADDKVKQYRYRLKGKKASRTIFMSEQLQLLMNEYCIENALKIGDFVELAIIEHLNRSGMKKRLTEILSAPPDTFSDEGEQGELPKSRCEQGKMLGKSKGNA